MFAFDSQMQNISFDLALLICSRVKQLKPKLPLSGPNLFSSFISHCLPIILSVPTKLIYLQFTNMLQTFLPLHLRFWSSQVPKAWNYLFLLCLVLFKSIIDFTESTGFPWSPQPQMVLLEFLLHFINFLLITHKIFGFLLRIFIMSFMSLN